VSPAFAIASSDSFNRDLARIIPITEKGIEKEVESRFPEPTQKEREISTAITPKIRLRIPLNLEKLLILSPPARQYGKGLTYFSFNQINLFLLADKITI